MNERIKYIRKDQGLTLEKFGERLGVTKTAISNIEKGKRNISEQLLLSICREYHVNETWLRTGAGEPYKDSIGSIVQKMAEEYNLRDLEITVLTEYLKLNESQRKACMDYLENVIIAQSKKRTAAAIAMSALDAPTTAEAGFPENAAETPQADVGSSENAAGNTPAGTDVSQLTVEEAEEIYKSSLSTARKKDFTALNITKGKEA